MSTITISRRRKRTISELFLGTVQTVNVGSGAGNGEEPPSGSTPGHVITDDVQSYPQRANLQFLGGVEVDDSPGTDSTQVTVAGPGSGMSNPDGPLDWGGTLNKEAVIDGDNSWGVRLINTFLNVKGFTRIEDATGTPEPVTGSGIEMLFSGGQGEILTFNRDGAAFVPLRFRSQYFTFQQGWLGIGVTVPTAPLHVVAPSTHIRIGTTELGNGWILEEVAGGNMQIGGGVNFLGINTSVPNRTLSVDGSAGYLTPPGLGTWPTWDGRDFTSKDYVDFLGGTEGLQFKPASDTATDANIVLSGLQTVGGYTVVAGDQVLVKNQTNRAENGLYLAAVGAWMRTPEMNASEEVFKAFSVVNNDQSNFHRTGWVALVEDPDTFVIGTDDIVWVLFITGDTINAFNGLTQDQNNVKWGGDLIEGTTITQAGFGITFAGGLFRADSIRAVNNQAPTSGAGLELKYNTSSFAGEIVAYDRNLSAYRGLRFEASAYDFDIGNVGINVGVNPTANLHVNGSVRLENLVEAPDQFLVYASASGILTKDFASDLHWIDKNWFELNNPYGIYYRLDSKLVVHLKKFGGQNIPSGTNLGTLPNGYRPSGGSEFWVGQLVTGNNNSVIEVEAGGAVIYTSTSAAQLTIGFYVQFGSTLQGNA